MPRTRAAYPGTCAGDFRLVPALMPHSGLSIAIGVLAATLPLFGAIAPAQNRPEASSVRAFSIGYADGRTSITVLLPKGGMWTHRFPRLPGAEPTKDGRPLERLHIAYTADGQDLLVTVSLGYSHGLADPVHVDTVRVTSAGPVSVDALRAHGVQPVTLSIVRLAPPVQPQLAVTSVSGALDVRVDPVSWNHPSHRVTVVNRSARTLHVLDWAMYHDDTQALSGRRKGRRNEYLLKPGETDTFIVTPSAGRSVLSAGPSPIWSTWDRLAILAVRWDDGLIEGDATVAEHERQVDNDRAAELTDLLERFRGQTVHSTAEFRRVVRALPPVRADGRLHVREAVAADIDAFEAEHQAREVDAFDRWLAAWELACRQWLDRIRDTWR
jgi:hypothetical protein